jgi:hypothetical protein
MQTHWAFTAPVLLFGILPNLLAADQPKAVDVDSIKDKVRITLREEATVEFNRDGERLLQPSKSKGIDAKKVAVRIKLDVTAASPGPPPRVGATRPFLDVENGFEKSLQFRALVRLKGRKEFFEIPEAKEPLPAGDHFQKCWEFDSLVEEVVLCEFKLSDK